MITKSALALLALATAGAAQAVTFTTSPFNAPIGATEDLLVTFDVGEDFDSTGFTASGDFALATGTSDSSSAPAGDTTQYFYVSSAIPGGSATLTSGFDLTSISFYWGSIDNFNSVDILGLDGEVIFSLAGNNPAFAPAVGNLASANSNRRVYFTAGAGEIITGITLNSTGVAFEIDDIAGTPASDGGGIVVPEPETWAMMIAGFGMVGLATRRRRRSAAVTA